MNPLSLQIRSHVAATAWLLLLSRLGFGADCEMLQPWLAQAQQALPAASSTLERSAQDHLEYELREKTADQLWSLYSAGKLDRAAFEACLEPVPNRGNFLETFYSTLFRKSVEKLDASRSPAIQTMIRMFHEKYGLNIPIFRVTGSFKEMDTTPLSAGYHRATGSMYMNFATIDPNDWLIIFVHETLHALDEQIWVGIKGYNNSSRIDPVLDLAQRSEDFSKIQANDQERLRKWILFGLDRGLLAEYRAWNATFEIYQQGKAEGLWPERPWLKEVLARREPGEALDRFTYRYLDSQSSDPSDGIFSKPLLSSALKEVRRELRQSPTPPPLAGLGAITQPNSAFFNK